MEVTRESLDLLTKEVNLVSAEAQNRLLKVLNVIDWSKPDMAKRLTAEAFRLICGVYPKVASQAAADFYDAVRLAETGEVMGAKAYHDYNHDATLRVVYAKGQNLDEETAEAFKTLMLQRMAYEVKAASFRSIAANGARDSRLVRYYRVPTGFETCGFCLMLASFGSSVSAEKVGGGHVHANCDCQLVPMFKEQAIKLYDQEGMYDRFKELQDGMGGRSKLREEWRKEGLAGKVEFDKYVNRRMAKEIGKKPEWFKSGK